MRKILYFLDNFRTFCEFGFYRIFSKNRYFTLLTQKASKAKVSRHAGCEAQSIFFSHFRFYRICVRKIRYFTNAVRKLSMTRESASQKAQHDEVNGLQKTKDKATIMQKASVTKDTFIIQKAQHCWWFFNKTKVSRHAECEARGIFRICIRKRIDTSPNALQKAQYDGIIRIFGILFLFLAFLNIANAEPSAFEMQSGATKKDMRDLKDIADFTRSVISDFQNKIVNLEQAIDGMKTVYEGMSATYRQDSLTLKAQVEKIENLQQIVDSYQSSQKMQVETIRNLKAQVEANTKNIEALNAKLDKLSSTFIQANDEILKQIQVLSQQALVLQNSIQSIQNQPIIESIKQDSTPQDSKSKNFSSDNAANLKEAKNLLRQKRFDDAKPYFEHLIDSKFAVAEASYYLGEIYYVKKEYNEALPYYKTSASLDSKASYMPILLWHTAWSFKYLGDDENYKKFLGTLAKMFPGSEQGKKAADILQN